MLICHAPVELIVFPELFLPHDRVRAIQEFASEKNISVICGIEGRWEGESYINAAAIMLTGTTSPYYQHKRYASVDEPANLLTKGGQLCFLQTHIGSFSVVICSDFREFDIIRAIEGQSYLDFVVVCTCNPYSEVFSHMAIADALRLHAYVLVANWSEERDAYGFGVGTCCASPRRDDCLASPAADAIVRLTVQYQGTDFGGSLWHRRLEVGGLFRDREKPGRGFFSPPRRRLHINK